jgi:hypothetical protein
MASPNPAPTAPLNTKISRRALIGGVFGALVLASRPTGGLSRTLGSPFGEKEIELHEEAGLVASITSSIAHYVPHIGSRFDLVTPLAGLVPVVLVEAVAAPVKPSGQVPVSGEAFSLLFEGATGAIAVEGTYLLRHARLPETTHFVSPVGRGLKAQDYQIVVDQRVFTSGSAPKKEG